MIDVVGTLKRGARGLACYLRDASYSDGVTRA